MRIAVCDYHVVPSSPAGSCVREIVRELAREHEVVVFALSFDDPTGGRARFRRVPAPERPLVLLFLAYHLLAPMVLLVDRLRARRRFDLVVSVESNLLVGRFRYSQYCHRAYLAEAREQRDLRNPRELARWANHRAHAALEPLCYRRSRLIVAASRGLRREFRRYYPEAVDALVIPNPVDLERFRPATPEERGRARAEFLDEGVDDATTVLAFVALGHFERKGLPLVIEALAAPDVGDVRLMVIGGRPDVVRQYQQQAAGTPAADRVLWCGFHEDVSPILRAADAMVLPTEYEVFPLAALQGAAAGLPLLATFVNGIEEFLVDGVNGFVVERSAASVRNGLDRLRTLPPEERRAMNAAAVAAVRGYDVAAFRAIWAGVMDDSLRGITPQLSDGQPSTR